MSIKKRLIGAPIIWNLVSAVRRHRAKDPELRKLVANHNSFLFNELGISREIAEAMHYATLDRAGLPNRNDDSFHKLAFAAIAASGFKPKTILELGTRTGATAAYLAALFPEATVHTVDLPPSDALYQQWVRDPATHESDLARTLASPNIVSHRINTAFLPSLDLPKFDLIWLDAGHQYPEVAWDHFYCIDRLQPGGWMLSDDIGADNPCRQTLDYFADRGLNVRYLLKRENPEDYLWRPKKLGLVKQA